MPWPNWKRPALRDSILAVRTKYLGRKGLLTGLLKYLIRAGRRKAFFRKRCNEVKELLENIEEALQRRTEDQKAGMLAGQQIDVTLPGRGIRAGSIHPVVQIRREICDIFAAFGFSVVEGPEVELDYYNFEALNIPKDHPARDMQDTFYIEENMVLRTHTSPVQVGLWKGKAADAHFVAGAGVPSGFRCFPHADVSSGGRGCWSIAASVLAI